MHRPRVRWIASSLSMWGCGPRWTRVITRTAGCCLVPERVWGSPTGLHIASKSDQKNGSCDPAGYRTVPIRGFTPVRAIGVVRPVFLINRRDHRNHRNHRDRRLGGHAARQIELTLFIADLRDGSLTCPRAPVTNSRLRVGTRLSRHLPSSIGIHVLLIAIRGRREPYTILF
jgi:hypothetical protein